MAPKTILFLSHLRRSSSSSLSPLSTFCISYLLYNRNHLVSPTPTPPPQPQLLNSLPAFRLCLSESFSTRSTGESDHELWTNSELVNTELNHVIDSGACTVEESILPVRALISLLDGFHDFTGLPWWFIIVSSTIAMRMALSPLLILKLHKLKRISELFPKLPPPLPPPMSGRSYIDQISLFQKERRSIGCPSFLWFVSYLSVQVPCFFLWMSSIRRMSLDHHPGFDCGGIFWFQNLTEYPHGISGSIFPVMVAAFHYINIQISFRDSSVQKVTGNANLLLKYYKDYLDLLTIPLFFIGFCLPQGSLVYWATNSSVSIIQQLCLKNPAILTRLGLPVKDSQQVVIDSEEPNTSKITPSHQSTKEHKISVQDLSPKQLVNLSVKRLSEGHKEKAIPLLQLALEKDPGYARALIVLGQILMQKGLMAEATEHLERAISQLLVAGYPSDVEEIDLLILASQWAGVTCIKQERNVEGIVHLQRVANVKEPEDPKSKAHYFDGLVLLASALYREGRKAEAAKYLRLAAAYDPKYNEFLEQCENPEPEEDFASDIVSSRRRDY
ncbi:putative cytochrome oxidase biogenesis protein [Tripterygium wilfordii]|uniref:Putative cytochrome oxidase biogenesis protein n=1 Tax=Tripterygium wilfordii TaxID=458696 RepID=A0A7J7CHK8_TRIWF|nr:ALBINO3-like protein 2, chloroplastic [Tripterygium wilfordii]XP_038681558.1 ALBINO3-like protein 2, chloroplastic [Tripterygium wilfordii]XP_038681559.1 ALBINO3-like protein 2, chloroplastic [Tripterygium wilfordii]KAF5733543.1 putative cytochrome oxidase biogenesis protein [Tripterygium wilfordii]